MNSFFSRSAALAMAVLVLPCATTFAQSKTTPEIISPQVKAAVEKAISWLLKQQ